MAAPARVQDRPYQRGFVSGDPGHPGVMPLWRSGVPAVLGVLPTGCGKTVCAGLVVAESSREQDRPTLFLAHREELVGQAATTFAGMGLDVGVEMADRHAGPCPLFGAPDVIVATVQSLQGDRLRTRPRSEFGAIITDECHHAISPSYKRVFDHFEDALQLGITATPDRSDGRNLGSIYAEVAYEYSLRSAIRDHWLVPIATAQLQCGVDLRGLRATLGDYSAAVLEERIGPHVEALCRIARAEMGGRTAVVFTPDVASAGLAAATFTALGSPARAVSGKQHKDDRRRDLAAFAAGAYPVVCCCDLLIEGWDCPRVDCVIVMRPTKQRSRYAQMIGRGTRPWRDKADLLVLDFAWETTAKHELACAIDLFDDSDLDDDVLSLAGEILASGVTRDPTAAIDLAEIRHRERAAIKVTLTGARSEYVAYRFDPVGVGGLIGVAIKSGWDFNPANPATPAQLAALRRMGVDDPDGLSKNGAGKIMGALGKRRDANLATLKQVAYLASLGVDLKQARLMGMEEANATLDRLSPRGGRGRAG